MDLIVMTLITVSLCALGLWMSGRGEKREKNNLKNKILYLTAPSNIVF